MVAMAVVQSEVLEVPVEVAVRSVDWYCYQVMAAKREAYHYRYPGVETD